MRHERKKRTLTFHYTFVDKSSGSDYFPTESSRLLFHQNGSHKNAMPLLSCQCLNDSRTRTSFRIFVKICKHLELVNEYILIVNYLVSKWWLMSWDKISTHVSGTPGKHQCMQSCPQTATASFLPNQMAGWASALNSLKWVRSRTSISVSRIASSMRRFIVLASLFTPLLLGSNQMSSCPGIITQSPCGRGKLKEGTHFN